MPHRFAWLQPIAAHAAALRDSLQGLSADERMAVGRLLARGCGNLLTFTPALDALADGAADAFGPEGVPPRRRRGAPKKSSPFRPGAPAYEAMVGMLQALVAIHGGERLTVYVYDGAPAGTLWEALSLLAPHLWPGLLNSLTSKVLRRLSVQK
jgi:hypothetical protein